MFQHYWPPSPRQGKDHEDKPLKNGPQLAGLEPKIELPCSLQSRRAMMRSIDESDGTVL